MREMGIAGISPGPNLSKRNLEHRIYPYLLRNLAITHPNHVWGIDITYIRLQRGWMYPVALIDWYSRVTSGLSLSHAALATSLYHLAGIFCNIVVGWVLDKRGMVAAVIFPVIAVVATALLGNPMSPGLFIVVLFVSGFSVIGTQFVLTTMGPKLFPTSYRSSANGILQEVGFIGTIGGPIIGGALMGAKLSVKELFLVNSGLLVISAILLLLMGLGYRRQLVLEKKATSKGYASPGN